MNSLELFTVILNKYQPLLKSLANRYSLRGEYEECFAHAQIALYEAYQHFDPKKGHFAPYAKRYITGKLLHYVRKELRYRAQHYFPSQSEDEDGGWEERIVDSTAVDPFALSPELNAAIAQLSPREQAVILHYFVLDRSLEELAQLQGVTHSTVSTWKRRALAKLNRMIASKEKIPS